jgi:hypothetical protein
MTFNIGSDGGGRWAEVGQYYVSLNESVIALEVATANARHKRSFAAMQKARIGPAGSCREQHPAQS